MSLTQQAITVDDFSGGITDYVLDAKPNQSAELENFLINPNRKIESATGSQIYDAAMYQIPDGNQRVCGIFASQYPELLINSARKIWRPNVSSFAELVGPSSNPAFSVGTVAGFPSFTEWNDHVLATNTEFALPIKMYKDGSAVWQTRTAGLPDLASSPTVAQTPQTYTFTVTAANATTGATYTNNGNTFTVVTTIASGTTLVTTSAGPPTASGTLTKSAGTGDATITFSAVASPSNSYIYAFLYYYTYTVGTTVFDDFGPTTLVTLASASPPNTNAVAISAIPVLANSTTGNYDTTNVKVYIYRSIAGGTTLYKIGQVNNGTTTFSDTVSDTTAQTGLLLYTNSGVLDNDPPPLAKYVHMVNGVAYYAHTKTGSQVFKNRIRQSVQDDPDSCPEGNYIDVLDEITGFSSFNDNPLAFTKNHVYRLNGQYNELGQGQVIFEDITKTIGCMSHGSIVQTRYGVFWAGNDGFYWTDGFDYKKISDSINERYKNLVSTTTRKARICGTYDTKDNRVIWAVTYDDSATDNDSFFTLDLRWGIRDDSTFTTRSNGSVFSPTGITFYEGQLIRADRRGYVFKHDTSYTTDPNIDTTKAPSLWTTKVITPRYASAVSNLGMPFVRKWVSKVLLTMENVSNVSVQISSINDNDSKVSDLKEIRYRSNVLWGDPNLVWGSDLPLWSFFNLIEEMRRFAAGHIRCSYKQLIITQAFTNIYNSDTIATATVNTMLKTVTMDDVLVSWPEDIQDYYITFEDDDYVREYLITARTSATVFTYLDAQNTAPSGSQKWLIRGYPKGELFSILSFVVYFAPLSDQSYKTWRVEQDSTGGNA